MLAYGSEREQSAFAAAAKVCRDHAALYEDSHDHAFENAVYSTSVMFADSIERLREGK